MNTNHCLSWWWVLKLIHAYGPLVANVFYKKYFSVLEKCTYKTQICCIIVSSMLIWESLLSRYPFNSTMYLNIPWSLYWTELCWSGLNEFLTNDVAQRVTWPLNSYYSSHIELDKGLDMVDKTGVGGKNESVRNNLVMKQTILNASNPGDVGSQTSLR